MGYFFASLISTVFSTFLFFHFSISVSRINDAVGVRKGEFSFYVVYCIDSRLYNKPIQVTFSCINTSSLSTMFPHISWKV